MNAHDLDRGVAAYHEAGHAVIAILLDVPFSSMDIAPDGLGGCVDFLYYDRLDLIDKRQFLCDIAGPIAERWFRARVHRDEDGLDPEILETYYVLRRGFIEETALQLLEFYMQLAGDILKLHWSQVQLIAETLLERNRLTRREVVDVLATSHP